MNKIDDGLSAKTIDDTPSTSESPGNATTSSEEGVGTDGAKSEKRDWRLWGVLTPLLLSTFMAAIESTIISAALPFIADQLHAGSSYVWFVNAYLLAKVATIPLWAQAATVAGRRWPIIFAVALFILGSGVAGGASSTADMIGGRTVQGLGGGGITIIGQLIITDLVPPRQVPKYIGYLFITLSFGTSIGPFLGGVIVQHTTWRWVFYINLPIGALVLVLMYFLLQVEYTSTQTFSEKLKRVDYLGNGLIVLFTTITLISLSWGGAQYPWSSPQVITLLIVGVLGLVGAFFYEAWSPWVKEATINTAVFRNYSTDIGLFLAFMQYLFAIWVTYFLPVYFQAVLLESTEIAGALLLLTVFVPLPIAAIIGRLITRYGKYKVFHVVGFAAMTIGFGLFTIFTRRTSLGVVIISAIIWSIGLGQLLTSTLPAVQASVDDKLRGPATTTWSFFREFGGVWGTAVPAAIFNSQFGYLVSRRITDPKLQATLSNGNGYSFASASLIKPLPAESRQQVIGIFTDSLKLVFQIGLGLSALCFIVSLLQKEYELRKTHQSEYRLKAKKGQAAQ
ncbi:major facilitator superfamily domain-containing protein [Xylariaceae sp. AK1471]|nr:major facilitator superfamily domain-containing protein [Xylariaceae sp. AK1471]